MKNNRKPLLTVKGLGKTYIMGEVEVEALKEVNFEIFEGEFIVVLGPSGSGKSTLLNLIGGMDKIERGQFYFRDQPVHGLDKNGLADYRRNVIGFVFQFYNLMPTLNAYENIELAAELSKEPLSIDQVLKDVGLAERAHHFPAQMSGGQQQRVALARAIIKNPEILLCDEPTGALDTTTGDQVMSLLKSINQTYGKTIIVITHDTDIAKLADRVFHIRDGRLQNIEKVK